ncbi:MAG: YcgN family cysteine cluster protein [Methylococcales bacterium]|jgi:uncharacterized protein|nr:YcgN family cysteine cluster protein [Methylococcales bacterium]MBT7408441.1 YcgN family cysteine cluster protein [Methylococcales bacterium]
MTLQNEFWKHKTLDQLNQKEWESLCDHCGRCCLIKLEDEDTGDYYYTDIVCKYHDQQTCQCTQYQNRKTLVPSCLKLDPNLLKKTTLKWFPSTCAYRLLSENKELLWWHPLLSKQAETVESAGVSIKYKCISEESIAEEDWEDRIIDWVN